MIHSGWSIEIDCLDMAELIIELETMMWWNRDKNEKLYLQTCQELAAEGTTEWEGKIKAIMVIVNTIKKESNDNFTCTQ